MKKVFQLALACLVGYACYRFCHSQTAGFQLTKIYSSLPHFTQWELPPENLESTFTSPFRYLGSGGQSYAFVSEDGKTVLKLFKMHNLRQYPEAYRLALPGNLDFFRLNLLLKQKEKLQRTFASSYLAYTQLKEESGLLYLTLNPQPDLGPLQVTLIDQLGIRHIVALNKVPFALQKRATPALKLLEKQLRSSDVEGAKHTLDLMLTILKARHDRGIGDLDPAFRRNIGLSKDKALFIDIGGFCSEASSSHPLNKEREWLHHWIYKRSAPLADYLDARLLELELIDSDAK